MCPTSCEGAFKIDSPTLAAVKEFAPDSTVVSEDTPSVRDALAGDYGRQIEEA